MISRPQFMPSKRSTLPHLDDYSDKMVEKKVKVEQADHSVSHEMQVESGDEVESDDTNSEHFMSRPPSPARPSLAERLEEYHKRVGAPATPDNGSASSTGANQQPAGNPNLNQPPSDSFIPNGVVSKKARLAQAIFQLGLETASKADLEIVTGLTKPQQRQMLRKDGRGSLYNAFIQFTNNL
ncbi:hypothetical protein IAR55_006277 [Kwoniella newhampshirensis]|uniref:Uncharacterized protein n=1 Tax=Kwoniella newhampshirensis TaxID=1651941 RepID=A0AAW0YUY0_9TREE